MQMEYSHGLCIDFTISKRGLNKMVPLCRRNFQMYVLGRTISEFIKILQLICYQIVNWQKAIQVTEWTQLVNH